MSIKDYAAAEQTTLDYKEKLEERRPKSWLKSVSAFANTSGGHLLFGVQDETHEAVGLEDPQYVISKVTELIQARIRPVPRFDLTTFRENGVVCVDLRVADGPAYPYYYAFDGVREAYIRVGDQSIPAPDYALNNLILKGQNKTFDSLPTRYRTGDVSFTLLGATFRKETGDPFDYDRDPVSIGLVDEEGQVTNAGLLLCDQGLLKQSRVFCTHWKGSYKGTVEEDALDDREYQDSSLITLLQNAEDFIRNNSKTPWTIQGMQRVERSDYPLKSVREALVNALIHRDYQVVGSEIHVDMFQDRLEIASPGGMLNGKLIQNMDLRHIPSLRRNQIISDVFARLHLMERRGSGIGRILSGYTGFDRQPDFFSDPDFFIVTLPNIGFMTGQVEQTGESPVNAGENPVNAGESPVSEGENRTIEIEEFEIRLRSAMAPLREDTLRRVLEMFRRYGYEYPFNRNNVADSFGVRMSYASDLINRMVKGRLVRKEKRGVYYFTK